MMHQELIDAIVEQVDCKKSLKACALAASSFRGASQRILLRFFTLKGSRAHGAPGSRNPANHSAVYALLTESPHIAPYISDLKIVFPSAPTPPEEVDSLKRVLAKLTKVKRCIITGIYISKNHQGTGWGDLVKALSSPLLDFISRQSLRELHIQCIILPLEVLLRLLMSAPTVSLYFAYLSKPSSRSKKSKKPAAISNLPSAATLESLILAEDEGVSKVLAGSDFAAYTANLRRLAVTMRTQSSAAMISAAAPTLEHLRIYCHDAEVGMQLSAILSLPQLRSLDVALHLEQRDASWLPFLEEVIVTYFSGSFKTPDALDYPSVLRKLEKLLLSRSTPPRIRWRVELSSKEFFAQITNSMPQLMPKLHAAGKVVVEGYQEEDLHGEGLPYPTHNPGRYPLDRLWKRFPSFLIVRNEKRHRPNGDKTNTAAVRLRRASNSKEI
ncbi:hypothetical protein B0H13DRAFT_1915400 [Mycena leptocephala]|nr:hypothetical protein B0H13DRAFT_1915400 [Mycena leptocephala]